jgi:hypothetical protein
VRWYQKEPHKEGDRRVRTGFLLLPKEIGGEWRWLERCFWEEEYSHGASFEDTCGGCVPVSGWVSVRWVDGGGE